MNTLGLDSQNNESCDLYFHVDGVSCSKCVQKLESLGQEFASITDVRFDKGRQLLKIEAHDAIAPSLLIQKIKARGYDAYFIEPNTDNEKLRKESHRRWLMRLAVTFFFASNLMMFSIALYLGALGPLKSIFAWACGVFFLPLVFFSAVPFYKSAIQALRDRRFSADMAITIAFLWGSGLSYFNLFRGSSDFYFDSTASFLFLILLARFLLERAQLSLESDLNPSLLFKDAPQFTKLDPSIKALESLDPSLNGQKLLYHQIQKEDVLQVYQNQTVPVDAEILSESVAVDLALFSGESLPHTYFRGDQIKAGMKIASPQVIVRTLRPFKDTDLQRLFDKVVSQRFEKTSAHSKAEIYSQKLLLTVSLLSLALLGYFGFEHQWTEGFRRALALFTIACPCALALAIPLASVMSLKRAMEKGLLVRTPLFFERLATVQGVAFDKTGTLTQGHLEVYKILPENLEPQYQSLLLAMEEKSTHPMAQSLTHFLKSKGVKPFVLESFREIPGLGITASFGGETYEIRRIENPMYKAYTGFQLTHNQNGIESLLCQIYFKDQLRPDSATLIEKLKKRGLDVQILSGDRPDVVLALGQELNLPKEALHASLGPQDKALFLAHSKTNYFMIGDGHNDALALAQATASLAVKGSADTSLRAADAYSQKNSLNIILLAFQMSDFYLRLIKQNLFLSLLYNSAAGITAMLGHIDPLVAAILMPVNSLIVIGATALARPPKTKDV